MKKRLLILTMVYALAFNACAPQVEPERSVSPYTRRTALAHLRADGIALRETGIPSSPRIPLSELKEWPFEIFYDSGGIMAVGEAEQMLFFDGTFEYWRGNQDVDFLHIRFTKSGEVLPLAEALEKKAVSIDEVMAAYPNLAMIYAPDRSFVVYSDKVYLNGRPTEVPFYFRLCHGDVARDRFLHREILRFAEELDQPDLWHKLMTLPEEARSHLRDEVFVRGDALIKLGFEICQFYDRTDFYYPARDRRVPSVTFNGAPVDVGPDFLLLTDHTGDPAEDTYFDYDSVCALADSLDDESLKVCLARYPMDALQCKNYTKYYWSLAQMRELGFFVNGLFDSEGKILPEITSLPLYYPASEAPDHVFRPN